MSNHIIRYTTATLHSMPYPKDQLKLLLPKEKRNAKTMCQVKYTCNPIKVTSILYAALSDDIMSKSGSATPRAQHISKHTTKNQTTALHWPALHLHSQSKIQNKSVQIGSSIISASSNARNLGIQFDSTMSMDNHIKKVCQSSFFQICNLSSIRKMLPNSTAEILVHAFITSRLDNGNAL